VYLQDQINSSRQEDGRKLVSSIKEELISHIENVRWKNDLYKEDHLDLYENLEEIIGGPDEMFDDGFISKYLYVGQVLLPPWKGVCCRSSFCSSIFLRTISFEWSWIGPTVLSILKWR
jgi:hypothetical protein